MDFGLSRVEIYFNFYFSNFITNPALIWLEDHRGEG